MTIKLKRETPPPVPKKPTEPTHALSNTILLGILTGIITLSLISYKANDLSVIFDSTALKPTGNFLGYIGAQCAALLLYAFGISAWMIPITFAYCLRTMIFGLTWKRELDRIAGLALFIFVGAAVADSYSFELYRSIHPGGWFGSGINALLAQFFTPAHTTLFLFMLCWALGLIVARFSFISYLYPIGHYLQRLPLRQWAAIAQAKLQSMLPARDTGQPEHSGHEMQPAFLKRQAASGLTPAYQLDLELEEQNTHADFEGIDAITRKTTSVDPSKNLAIHANHSALGNNSPIPLTDEDNDDDSNPGIQLQIGAYQLPPLTLFPTLKETVTDPASLINGEQLALTLEHKLDRFGIKGKVVMITHGPAVTLFEYQPSIDTKISTILAREDDLALALQALSLRIIAPIPGRSVIGFEVAHNKRRPVLFSHALKSNAFASFQGALPLILGKDTLGQDVVIDLATMPHLLVAGSTGSGKSVGLHTMIMSLLCSKTPEEVKFILIDPKRLEFATYADCAHLLFPIVTDPRRAVAALKWAVETMEDRYATMALAGVRNCAEYNSRSKPGEENFFPLIVVIIDELADLMMTAGKDVEHNIARLAQMARAAGIHLIAATQRPSVDVITGLIKVNFPSRIAYKVTSKVDSRTILDMMGAEKLLGKGDMLFLDVKGAVHRVHGAYVTDTEINAVAQYIKAQQPVQYQELTSLKNNEEAEQDGDELFQEVIHYIKNKDEISISLIQRVFRIGYNRSARIVEQLESYGYLLPADGSKMRKVSKEQ